MASFNPLTNCLHVTDRQGSVHVYLDDRFTCTFQFSFSSKFQLLLDTEVVQTDIDTSKSPFHNFDMKPILKAQTDFTIANDSSYGTDEVVCEKDQMCVKSVISTVR